MIRVDSQDFQNCIEQSYFVCTLYGIRNEMQRFIKEATLKMSNLY
jgi:hypothetical protein